MGTRTVTNGQKGPSLPWEAARPSDCSVTEQ